jgi:hypothetical protein
VPTDTKGYNIARRGGDGRIRKVTTKWLTTTSEPEESVRPRGRVKIAQDRLGPAGFSHCMRWFARRSAFDLMSARELARRARQTLASISNLETFDSVADSGEPAAHAARRRRSTRATKRGSRSA